MRAHYVVILIFSALCAWSSNVIWWHDDGSPPLQIGAGWFAQPLLLTSLVIMMLATNAIVFDTPVRPRLLGGTSFIVFVSTVAAALISHASAAHNAGFGANIGPSVGPFLGGFSSTMVVVLAAANSRRFYARPRRADSLF